MVLALCLHEETLSLDGGLTAGSGSADGLAVDGVGAVAGCLRNIIIRASTSWVVIVGVAFSFFFYHFTGIRMLVFPGNVSIERSLVCNPLLKSSLPLFCYFHPYFILPF